MKNIHLCRRCLLVLILFSLILLSSCIKPGPSHYHLQTLDLKDSDHDGVINARDHCIATPAGTRVDNQGCPILQESVRWQEKILYFPYDSAEINDPQLSILETIAHRARNNPGIVIELTGHASLPGANAYNLALSHRRAEKIRQVLVNAFRVDQQKIKVRWRGEQQPVMPGHDRQAHQLNQRVSVLMVLSEQQPVPKWSSQTFTHPVFQ